jgi:hypothetical protein
MKPFRIVVVCATLFAAFCISAREPLFAGGARTGPVKREPPTDVLSGRVLDSAGVPIAGALVEATSLATDVVLTARTDAWGRYKIVFRYGIGDYLLAARHIGMAPGQLMLRRTSESECLGGDILLAPIPLKVTKAISS